MVDNCTILYPYIAFCVTMLRIRLTYASAASIDINFAKEIMHGKMFPDNLISKKSYISFPCCLRACHEMDSCRSINYYPALTLCDLNNEYHSSQLKTTKNALHVHKESLISEPPCENISSIGSLVDCGFPDEFEYSTVNIYQGTGLYSKAFYTCNEFYALEGKSNIGCKEDGTWGYRTFQCKPDYKLLETKYEGCFVDTAERILNGPSFSDNAMTLVKCVTFCKANSYRYAGVQFHRQCFCGNTNNAEDCPETECNTPCIGDMSRMCGGTWRMSVYKI